MGDFDNLPGLELRPLLGGDLAECARCGGAVPITAWGNSGHAAWHRAVEGSGRDQQPPRPVAMGMTLPELVDALSAARQAFSNATPDGHAQNVIEGYAARLYLAEKDLERVREQYAGLTQGETARLRRIEDALVELGAPNRSEPGDPGGLIIKWARTMATSLHNALSNLETTNAANQELVNALDTVKVTLVELGAPDTPGLRDILAWVRFTATSREELEKLLAERHDELARILELDENALDRMDERGETLHDVVRDTMTTLSEAQTKVDQLMAELAAAREKLGPYTWRPGDPPPPAHVMVLHNPEDQQLAYLCRVGYGGTDWGYSDEPNHAYSGPARAWEAIAEEQDGPLIHIPGGDV